jgi:hypothetical protein
MAFAGVRARTANLTRLAEAYDLLSRGADSEDVRKSTAWFVGADKKWRFEIDDSVAVLDRGEDSSSNKDVFLDWIDEAASRDQGVPLGRILNHPELFAAYPILAAIRVKVNSEETMLNASLAHDQVFRSVIQLPDPYSLPFEKSSQLLAVLMHEVQHAIQREEGFTPGANLEAVGMEMYERSAGEVEARNVQRRQQMSISQRLASSPFDTADVRDEMLVFNHNPGDHYSEQNAVKNAKIALELLSASELASSMQKFTQSKKI